jgi:hypothetical protein
MKAAAIIVCGSLLFAASASADEKSDAMMAYMLCARHMAVRFEPSGESPESIATAATWACINEGANAFNILLHDPNPGTSPTDLEQSARAAAVGQVVGVRLCKKTKDCAYAHVP